MIANRVFKNNGGFLCGIKMQPALVGGCYMTKISIWGFVARSIRGAQVVSYMCILAEGSVTNYSSGS